MVFKKNLDHGFHTFNVRNVPRAPRSIRRSCRSKREIEDSRICAFELLASLAGKLLEENESSTSSNASEGHDRVSVGNDVVKSEIHYDDDDKLLKIERVEQGICEVVSSIASDSIDNLDHISINTQPACSDKISDDLKPMFRKGNVAYRNFRDDGDLCSPDLGELCDGKNDLGFKQERDTKGSVIGKSSIANACPSKDPVELPMTFPAPIKRDVKLSSRRDLIPNPCFSRHRNDIKLGSRDDDEKFSRFSKLSYRFKSFRPRTSVGHRRIRKLQTSKYWKVAPKLKDYEHSKADVGIKPLYRKRKTYHNFDRCQYDTLYKRRKFVDRSSIVTSDGGISSESVCNSPEKVADGAKVACGTSLPSLAVKKASHQSKDSRVKFSIKSFRIPELYVEVPENATVGSLKRTVMEAVTALLGGGLRVGVLLQGKKVRDDNRTLSQTGISCDGNLDSLGFTLEPGLVKAPPPVCSEETTLPISCDTPPRTITSFVDTGNPDATPDPLLLTDSAHPVDSNHEPVTSQTDIVIDQDLSESRALVPVPAMKVEALAIIPASPKTRKLDLAQRRTRRPFSVFEVEALVHAVEELGTGRWRDIKLRAFENADHRTYVDLKDKWKTLVHTAKIAPQQRRGEPVPQELLDRVLAAHAHWSHHQAKQQGNKLRPGTLRITDAESDENGIVTVPTV